jgi:WD40 repeat protein
VNFFQGSADNKIVLWDTSSWTLHQELAVSASHVLALAWWRVTGEPDDATYNDAGISSDVLAAGTWEGQVLIWLGTNSSFAEGEL